jgi:proteasome lid subunit RPN8/RPN11
VPTLEIPAELLAAMRRLAQAAEPNEACGLLLGEGARVVALAPARNVAETQADAFEVDPVLHLRLQRMARARSGRDVLGVWHSHPRGSAVPSARDREGAWDESLLWLITAAEGTRGWCIRDQDFTELSILII